MPKIKDVVSSLLYTGQGQVLIQLRDDKQDIPYPNQWTPFGGQVEKDEVPARAVFRELEEELAISVPLTLWKTYVCPNRTIPGELIVMHYSYKGLLDRDISQLTQYEGQSMALFNAQDIAGLGIAFGQKPL